MDRLVRLPLLTDFAASGPPWSDAPHRPPVSGIFLTFPSAAAKVSAMHELSVCSARKPRQTDSS
ncbi:hypothetical protein [Gluconobacter wancherniae]|uniref:hypothetical protein n=1 Tax=Gluconobacter wancherniae TaxID=1307955 RepID=UPI001B8D78AB|nr:hypothetical protein [Gluconobacter wancherniae]MBS1062596.1 hypothetical protein [Gluconobacter wancherniae]MBS1088667.1 hypothetical protein [Gluconobacter wancherniae]MBS1094734.1 hypothetical protein [Gluconobacter wancherniae]